MSLSTLEAYDIIRFAEAFEARLLAAEELLLGREELEAEKQWLATALELVRVGRKPSAALLARVKDLPELEDAREEYVFEQQNLWVDALEKLHAGITFCASSRAPVIEALFPHLKFPTLRRAPTESVTEYAAAYERRLKSGYVTRIIAQEDFAFVRPVLEQVARAYASWQASLEPSPLPDEQARPLREELVALGRNVDVAVRQARLLAEASFTPIPGSFEATGLGAKPRKRPGRGLLFPFEGTAEGPSPTASEEEPPSAEEEPSASEEARQVAEEPAPEPEAPREETAALQEAPAPQEAPATEAPVAEAPSEDGQEKPSAGKRTRRARKK